MRIYPDYKKSVYNVPYTLLSMLGFKNSSSLDDFRDLDTQRLFFILIDGLGYDLFESNGCDFLDYDHIKITSLFPSTTAAALTTIFTGLSPKQHGILEWYMYYEEYGGIIKTLPFTTRDSPENDLLIKKGISPEPLFSFSTIFDEINGEGLKSNVYIRKEYALSSYTSHIFKNAEIKSYGDIREGFELMKKSNANMNSIYIDNLDTVQHRYGPNSKRVKNELEKILSYIRGFKDGIKDSIIIISADHGQTEIKKKNVVKLKRSMVGGSPRDMFVYSDEEIPGNLDVLNKEEILSLLGPGRSHPNLFERLPNHVVLPGEHEGIWIEDFNMKGLHGGLSSMEMYVPFLIIYT